MNIDTYGTFFQNEITFDIIIFNFIFPLFVLLLVFSYSRTIQKNSDLEISHKNMKCVEDFTNRVKKISKKIHKSEEFDKIFHDCKSYNKCKKEGKNFLYKYMIFNSTQIVFNNEDYYVITGKYYGKILSFIFEKNSDVGIVYNGHYIYIDTFIEMENWRYIDGKIFRNILNLYRYVFDKKNINNVSD
jgi:hypothetical protein